MTRVEMLAQIKRIGIVPAVRASSPQDALFASESVFSAGIPIVEITVTTPGALELISHLVESQPAALIGAGTVLDTNIARACVDAGAHFLTSTGFDPEVVGFARDHDVVMIPGALTPTEVMAAQRAGAAFIKIFPCSSVGGPAYIRALRGPFRDVPLIASGGVNQHTAAEYMAAGADVLGIGRELLPPEAVKGRNADWIHELARRYLGMVKHAREVQVTHRV